jgi:hypothetical protein
MPPSNPGTRWIAGRAKPRICLDDVEKREAISDPSVVQSVVTIHYTNRGIPAATGGKAISVLTLPRLASEPQKVHTIA